MRAVEQVAPVEAVEVARRLIGEMERRGCRLRTGRGRYPAVSGDYPFERGTRAVWALLGDTSGPTAPLLTINFGSLRSVFAPEELEDLLRSLEGIPEVQHSLRAVRGADFNHYPTVPLGTLALPGVLERFLAVWDRWIPGASRIGGPLPTSWLSGISRTGAPKQVDRGAGWGDAAA